MLNLHHLKIFYNVAKEKSIVKAAEKLGLSQPAVSNQLQKFQEDCSLKLINKTGKTVFLTDAGTELFKASENIFGMVHSSEEIIKDFQTNSRGLLRIDATYSFGVYHLPSIIKECTDQIENLRINVDTRTTDIIIKNIINFDSDIGIIPNEIIHPGLDCINILQDEIVMVVPKNHKLRHQISVTPDVLEKYPMILHPPKTGIRQIIDKYLNEHNVDINMIGDFNNSELLKKLVKRNFGITLLSRKIAAGENLDIISLNPKLYRSYYMIINKEKYYTPAFKQFIEYTKSYCVDYKEKLILISKREY